MNDRLPLFVITGFLGSGKTTLVQRLLCDRHGAGTGVVVNEFGEAGLDHRLVVHAAEHVELVGDGCMCCARRADLNRALYELVRLSREGSKARFRRAVVETSGLADPAPIVATLARDPWLRNNVQLARVIAVLDAANGLRNLAMHAEARHQIALADAVLITKTDLRAAAPFKDLVAAIRKIVPDVMIEDVQDPAFDFAELFASAPSDVPMLRGHRAAFHADEVRHENLAGSFTIALPAKIDWAVFTVWLSALLHAHGDRILRVKGLVRTSTGTTPLVIHGVQHTMHPPIHLTAEDDRPSFLVFITRDLARERIEASLSAFLRMATRGRVEREPSTAASGVHAKSDTGPWPLTFCDA